MHKMKKTVTAAVAAVFVTGLAAIGAAAEKPAPAMAPPESIKAFRDDKLGVCVWWGPSSLTGLQGYYSRGKPIPVEVYDNLYKKWKPDRFDARHLVDVVKRSGARSLCFNVKWLDGFNLYDTKFTDYKITGPESPWRHDVLKEVADACHAQGLKLWIKYSDAVPPSGLVGSHKEFVANQLRELLTNYGRIEGLLGVKGSLTSGEIITMCRTLQPHIIIDSRGLDTQRSVNDIDTFDEGINRSGWAKPWTNVPEPGYWSPGVGDLYIGPSLAGFSFTGSVLWRVVCDGCWFPSLGLMPDGRIDPETEATLLKFGEWMGKYGESIYETRGGPFDYSVWGGTTYRGKFIYIHAFRWQGDKIHLKPMERKIVSATVLTGGTATVKQTGQVIEVQVPRAQRDPEDTIIKLELDGPVDGMKPIPFSLTYDKINDERACDVLLKGQGLPCNCQCCVQGIAQFSFHKRARSSDYPEWALDPVVAGVVVNPYAPQMLHEKRNIVPGNAVDGYPLTRWECAKGVKSAWLEVDLRQKETFSHTAINECGDRVRRFELQVRDREDEPWRTVYTGTKIGEDFYATFPATSARYVRLNLIETADGPAIWEFQVF